MNYRIIPVTPFEQNCSLVWCPKTLQAAVVDPGGDLEVILQEIERQGVSPTAILLMIMVLIFLLGWPLEWVPIVLIIVPIL